MYRIVKKTLLVSLVFTLLFTYIPVNSTASTTRTAMIGISNSSALGDELKVPVKISNMNQLASGSFKVSAPQGNHVFSLKAFEISPKFNGDLFNTTSRVSGNTLYVDFISNKNVRVTDETVGYIVYNVSNYANKYSTALLSLEDVSLQNQYGRTQRAEVYNGTIKKQRPMGDVLGTDEVNAGQAVRILKHVEGKSPLAGPDVKEAADVDGDGNIAQADAMKVLRHIVGLDDSFIRISTPELSNAILNQEYQAYLIAEHGNEPYTWSLERGSRLPTGLRLDASTGIISGSATRSGEYTFSIEVVDRHGSTAVKEFSISVIESTVESMQQFDPVSVAVGEGVSLPETTKVLYKDGSTKYEQITWNAVNTATVGTQVVLGSVANTGLQISIEIVVHEEGEIPYIPEEQIQSISSKYIALLGVHTLQVNTTKHVYEVVVKAKVRNDYGRTVDSTIPMHYEGENEFSLATPRLASGQTITIVAFDRYGEKIIEKSYQVE